MHICTHVVPTFLAFRLRSPKVCPRCIVEQQILVIQEVQRELVDRGGTFKSKEDDPSGHKTIRMVWRDAKIALTNTIIKFEDLLKEKDVPAADLAELRDALDVWERKKIVLGRVPGVLYVAGAEEEEPTEDEMEGARLMMELLRMVVGKEMEGEEMAVATPTPSRPSLRSQLPIKIRRPLFAALDESQPGGTTVLQPKHTPILVKDTSDRMQQSRPTRPTIPKPSSKPLIEAQKTENATSTDPNLTSCPNWTRKSILKRPRTTTSHSHQHKRIRITDYATVSSEALSTSNPSPFHKLCNKPTRQAHSPHIVAEQQRPRSAFLRGSTLYTPGVWASSAHSRKANTSFFNVSPYVMKMLQKGEFREEEEEKELARGLRVVAGAWVGLWWVRNVVPGLDLGVLMEQ
ncbi:hypothetical protein BDW02DRAFT_557462 [Decorospora gaudefroyi]|uniref:Uncharacterized protein n=1 Tax=Decorospora gaudefroyi TaxID=184978 RepID=A0A6A5KCU5_9PLEO|nr:hypothetical protein BDW02DRAFT_557462 [Decorospora gaudefroyi]